MPSPELIALTRRVSKSLDRCELTYLTREPIDVSRAAAEHAQYEEALRRQGVTVESLPPLHEHPDAVFVEDTAVVVNELAVRTPLGTPSRRAESESVAATLSRFRDVITLDPPIALEGGDVATSGRDVFVGLSTRTNQDGFFALAKLLLPFGYRIAPVAVSGCLHLKTGCTTLGHGTWLVNPRWIDAESLRSPNWLGNRENREPPVKQIIEIAEDEPFAANALTFGKRVLLAASAPKTRQRVEAAGFETEIVDISELAKAEAGLTCMSVLFERGGDRGGLKAS